MKNCDSGKKNKEPPEYNEINTEFSGSLSNKMSGNWMDDMMHMEGLIEDFRRAYLQDIPENIRPYDKIVRRYYNEYVNKWFESSLKPNAINSKMTSLEGTDRWYSYFEATQTRATIKNWDLCLHCPEKLTGDWINIFISEDVDKIMEYGDKTGRDGYTMVKNKWDDWYTIRKYNICFKNNNIEEWLRQFKSEHLYFTHEKRPFDLDKIREKIFAIINEENIIRCWSHPEEPSNPTNTNLNKDKLICEIDENELPYNRSVKEYNNRLISEFYLLIENITDLNKQFWFFNEAKMIKASIDNWNLTYHPSEELVNKWLTIYDTKNIDEILDFGIRVVRDSMIILTLAFDDWVTKKKYNDCYIDGNMVKTIENLEKYSYGTPPFSFDKICEKIDAMLSPRNLPGPKRENIHRKIY